MSECKHSHCFDFPSAGKYEQIPVSPQGRPGVNGYKGEKGEPGGGAGYGYPVSVKIVTNNLTVVEIKDRHHPVYFSNHQVAQ